MIALILVYWTTHIQGHNIRYVVMTITVLAKSAFSLSPLQTISAYQLFSADDAAYSTSGVIPAHGLHEWISFYLSPADEAAHSTSGVIPAHGLHECISFICLNPLLVFIADIFTAAIEPSRSNRDKCQEKHKHQLEEIHADSLVLTICWYIDINK